MNNASSVAEKRSIANKKRASRHHTTTRPHKYNAHNSAEVAAQ